MAKAIKKPEQFPTPTGVPQQVSVNPPMPPMNTTGIIDKTTQPAPTPPVSTSKSSGGQPFIPTTPIDTSTLAGRLAAQNITPTQIAGEHATPGQQAVAGQVRDIYNKTPQQIDAETMLRQGKINQQQYADILTQIGTPTTEQQNVAIQAGQMQGATGNIIKETLGKATTAAGGAFAGGTLVTGGNAVIGGGAAVAAGIGSVAYSIYGGLKSEYQQETAVQYAGYTTSTKNIKAIIYNANHGGDKLEAVELYNQEIAKINAAESNLKSLAEKDWLSKARPELIKIQAFNDGLKQRYDDEMRAALLNPNPAYIADFGEVPV